VLFSGLGLAPYDNADGLYFVDIIRCYKLFLKLI